MKRRFLILLLALLTAASLFTGCSARNDSLTAASEPSMDSPASDGGYSEYMPAPAAAAPMAPDADTAAPAGESGGGIGAGGSGTSRPGGLKIIYTAYAEIQTTEWDVSYARLMELIDINGAYIQNSSISGGYTSANGYYSEHYADVTVRVPSEKYKAFLSETESVGTVIDTSENTDDITAVYIDTEARIKTLKAQETRLLELLSNAEEMVDLIEIESKLSDVRYQIESYQSQMNTYDNMLTYSTVTVYLREVSSVIIMKDTFSQRVSAAVSGSWETVVNFFDRLVIVLIYMAPFIIIALAVTAAVLLITKKVRMKRKSERENRRNTAGSGSNEPDASPYARPAQTNPEDDKTSGLR